MESRTEDATGLSALSVVFVGTDQKEAAIVKVCKGMLPLNMRGSSSLQAALMDPEAQKHAETRPSQSARPFPPPRASAPAGKPSQHHRNTLAVTPPYSLPITTEQPCSQVLKLQHPLQWQESKSTDFKCSKFKPWFSSQSTKPAAKTDPFRQESRGRPARPVKGHRRM